MPTTLNVADKPTLNSVKTDTDTLITRGGIRHNGTNPQVYDTTNNTWVDLPSGGSLSPTIIIKNHFYQWLGRGILNGYCTNSRQINLG